VSEHRDDLELQALQRELDDAFATTRPRSGYEDELWSRMQAHRPAASRFRDALAGFFQGIREVPAVPAAAVAALLVVVIGAGVFALSGLGRVGGGGASSAPAAGRYDAESGAAQKAGSFGRLPTPVLNRSGAPALNSSGATPATSSDYSGPVMLTWTGQLTVTTTTAPVFRYHEPSTNSADQFASSLGAALEERPPGSLGLYSTTTYKLNVRGTVQSPPQSPAYFILSGPSMAPIAAAGASPADIASLFLAEHSLVPQWPNKAVVKGSGDQVKVIFVRQFDSPGSGAASLIDSSGEPYGLEVDLNGNQVVRVIGLLPVNVDSAPYPIISADRAIRAALTSPPSQPDGSSLIPIVDLTHAELVYVLAPAGDHSFYEPAFLFSGTFQVNGMMYVKRVLVPAVDPTQRS
jgi:hypothetical protein